jgi:hypothetical protein
MLYALMTECQVGYLWYKKEDDLDMSGAAQGDR